MTDTHKPLVPLYPYQCPECEGKGTYQRQVMAFMSSTEKAPCAGCNGYGMVWLPKPHSMHEQITHPKPRKEVIDMAKPKKGGKGKGKGC